MAEVDRIPGQVLDSGISSNPWKVAMNVTAVVFVMGLFLLLMFWGHDWLQSDREYNRKKEDQLTKLFSSQQESINSNNHNMAGMTQAVNQLLTANITLRQEVSELKVAVESLKTEVRKNRIGDSKP